MTSPASLSQNTSAAPWQRAARGANLLSADGSLGVTIFEEMTTLALSTGAINLGQGFPDEDGPAEIKAAAQAAITAGANQYAPGKGIPELREAVAAHQERFYGLTPDPQTEVIVTTGATEAIAASLLAFIEPGDEVLTFEPFYDSYGAIIGLAGAKHVTAPLLAPGFLPDMDAMESAFSERTKVVLLNNPHNPTGAVFPREVLERVVELARKYDAVILSDEVYEHLTFGVQHLPIAGIPGAAERSVTISSAGKTFSFTGWKIGWLSGPAHLVAAIRTVKQFLSYSSGTPSKVRLLQASPCPMSSTPASRPPSSTSGTSWPRDYGPPASASTLRREHTSSTWTPRPSASATPWTWHEGCRSSSEWRPFPFRCFATRKARRGRAACSDSRSARRPKYWKKRPPDCPPCGTSFDHVRRANP